MTSKECSKNCWTSDGGLNVVGIEMAFRPLVEHEVWGADVGVVSLARWKEVPDNNWLAGSPEIVIEVLSPSNTASEMLDREETCMAGGCLEFWTVDTEKRKVRVTRRDDTAHIYKEGDSIPLPLFGARGRRVGHLRRVKLTAAPARSQRRRTAPVARPSDP